MFLTSLFIDQALTRFDRWSLSVTGILRHSSIRKMDSAGWQKYHRCRGLGNHHGSDPLLTVHFALGLGEVPEASKSLRLALTSKPRGPLFPCFKRRTLGCRPCGSSGKGLAHDSSRNAALHRGGHLDSNRRNVGRAIRSAPFDTIHRPGVAWCSAVLVRDHPAVSENAGAGRLKIS